MMATLTGNGQQQAVPGDGGRIVVGIDDSPGGLAALRWAVALARVQSAPLVAVRVWALGLPRHGGLRRRGDGRGRVIIAFAGAEARQEAVRLTRQAFGAAVGGIPSDIDVTIETPEGSPGPVLTQFTAAHRDMLVVGTTPRRGLKRAVHGSVSAYCSSHLPGQVSVVPAGSSRQDPGELDPAGTRMSQPGRLSAVVRR